MSTTAHNPIPVRRMAYTFTDDIPEQWGIQGNPFLTAVMGAMSASFPAGERYFIHSVNHYMKQIQQDKELLARVRGFMGQEGQHTKEHLAFNRFLDARGLPIVAIEKRVEALLTRFEMQRSPEEQLAHTVALEHLTAFLAATALEFPDIFFGEMHPTIAAFWGWHLIEEFEHRSVAFDVYQKYVGDEKLRTRTMAITTVMFVAINAVRSVRVMRAMGQGRNVRAYRQGIALMIGRDGLFRKMSDLYFAFYKPDFHPDDHQVDQDLNVMRKRFHEGYERVAATS